MATSLLIESAIWYGAVLFMLALRFIARLLHFKDIRKLQIEDWFMLLVFGFFTVLIVFLNICSDVSTNLIEPEDARNLSPEDIKDRVWGSKCVLIVESMMCSVQWGTKACLLILYYRLTENLRQRIVVRFAVGYCVVTFIVMMSLYYGYWCRPFSAFYAVPTPDLRCATQIPHLIVQPHVQPYQRPPDHFHTTANVYPGAPGDQEEASSRVSILARLFHYALCDIIEAFVFYRAFQLRMALLVHERG